ncbi:MAG: HDIG domain-containing protein [Anaerolineae bacterium]|nr:HDIG domain-containing protein [Anaerolineae bacterium]
MIKRRSRVRFWGIRQLLSGIWLTLAVSLTLIYAVPSDFDLSAGDVATQDIHAPRDITFDSQILSRQAEEEAVRTVPNHYTKPNPAIARQQYDRARQVLFYIRAVRADSYGSDNQRHAWIWAVPELADVPDAAIHTLLTLPDASWNRVELEFLNLLDQIMRQFEIKESDLSTVRDTVPSLIALDLAQDEARSVQVLVQRFIQPNVFFDENATEQARTSAREAVGPAFRTFRSGEIIIRAGAVVTPLDMEVLNEFGLTSTETIWPTIAGAVLFSVTSVFALGLYSYHMQPEILDGATRQLLFVLLLTFFTALAWVLIWSGELIPYLYPVAAAAMLASTTLGKPTALGVTAFLALASAWIGGRSMTLVTMLFLGGLFAVLTLPKYEQTGPLFRSGLLAGFVQAVVVFIFSVDEVLTDPISLMIKLSVCILGGIISGGLTVGGLFLLTPLFDLTTTFRLTELSRPNHPLLQRLLREAPATFNHVMMVASLAEQGAERIGANALLTRVGAYYHDIGKLIRPYFFSENQQGLSNPHDRLDPYTSVEVLSGHIRDGIKLAKQYHLPAKVRAFIPEHHGTMRVSFFYQKAVEAAGGNADMVDESAFRYPGPEPQSRETLLVMLADSSEAATRGQRPADAAELEKLITRIFQGRMDQGQMDGCPITLEELHTIKQTYIDLLRGAYHPRVSYPEPSEKQEEKSDHKTSSASTN